MVGKPRQLGLGTGVYTLAEVARLSGLNPSKVRRWFSTNRALLQSADRPEGRTGAVSFLDLVEAIVAGRLRDRGVSYSRVATAHKRLGDRLGSAHPFAHADLLTDGRDVFVRNALTSAGVTIEDASTNQQFFDHIIKVLETINLDYRQDRLAARWHIAPHVDVDPAMSFGKPVLAGTGITTFVIARQLKANNDDASLVAELYSLSEEQVMAAHHFEEGLRQSQKAA